MDLLYLYNTGNEIVEEYEIIVPNNSYYIYINTYNHNGELKYENGYIDSEYDNLLEKVNLIYDEINVNNNDSIINLNNDFVNGAINTTDGITESSTVGKYFKTKSNKYYNFKDDNYELQNNSNYVLLFIYKYDENNIFLNYNILGTGYDTNYTFNSSIKYRFGGRTLDNSTIDLSIIDEFNIIHTDPIIINTTLTGKNILNLGDSIFGNFLPPTDISSYIEKYTGATCYNCGFGGTYAAPRSQSSSAYPFDLINIINSLISKDFSLQESKFMDGSYDQSHIYRTRLDILKQVDLSKIDTITIAIGTNDYNASKILDNIDNRYDITTYAGALRYCIETLWNNYNNLKIILCTPIFRTYFTNGLIDSYADQRLNNNSNTLLDFVDTMIDVAKEYYITYIDNWRGLGINRFNRNYYFSGTDGAHPIEIGRDLIARHIVKYLF